MKSRIAPGRSPVSNIAAEGLQNRGIARRTGHDEPKVGRWRTRYAEQGLDGIIKDKTRPGRVKPISSAKKSRIVKLTLESKPKGSTHWSRTTMAKELGVSPSSVGRVWAAHVGETLAAYLTAESEGLESVMHGRGVGTGPGQRTSGPGYIASPEVEFATGRENSKSRGPSPGRCMSWESAGELKRPVRRDIGHALPFSIAK